MSQSPPPIPAAAPIPPSDPTPQWAIELPVTPEATACPRCRVPGILASAPTAGVGGTTRDVAKVTCPGCAWEGTLLVFHPMTLAASTPEMVGVDDAACAMHPHWRAIGTCVGSGDYVCELCRIEVAGKTYSAGYLSAAGASLLPKNYKNLLRRPDREFWLAALVSMSVCFGMMGVGFLVVCIVYIFEIRRACSKDPLLDRVAFKHGPLIAIAIGALIVLLMFAA